MSEEPRRFYGTDVTDDFDTIAEAWIDDDGVLHLSAVVLDRRVVGEVSTEPGRPQ